MMRPRLPSISPDIVSLRFEEIFFVFLPKSQPEPLRNPRDRSSSLSSRQTSPHHHIHKLKTAIEIRFDPASPIVQTFRHHAPTFAKPPVDRRSIAIAKSLNDHEEHAAYASSRLSTMDALVPP